MQNFNLAHYFASSSNKENDMKDYPFKEVYHGIT